jgi:uncharacterized RDD family membrane protein YckC
MKCPACGYVSSGDLSHCKHCGHEGEMPAPSKLDGGVRERTQEVGALFVEEEWDGAFPGESDDSVSVGEGDTNPSDFAGTTGGDFELPRQDAGFSAHAVESGDHEEDEFSFPDSEDLPPSEGDADLPDFNIDFDPGSSDDDDDELFGDGEEESAIPSSMWFDQGAGFARRLAAFSLDAAFLAGLLAIFFAGAVLSFGLVGINWGRMTTPEALAALVAPFCLLGLCLSFAYFTFFPGWMGMTPGKAVLGIEIQQVNGEELSFSRAFMRWMGYLLSATVIGAGFFWIIIDRRHRGWHDHLAGTWVKETR